MLEGLRALLRSSEPEIQVIELDVRKGPRRIVDVTLLDIYGEPDSLVDRARTLGADANNGAIVVFSSDLVRPGQSISSSYVFFLVRFEPMQRSIAFNA